MPPRAPTNRTLLNNVLQDRGQSNDVSWEDVVAGPQHQPMWTSKVFVKGLEYGEGTGGTKGEAREDAAGAALVSLRAERAERATS
ncbi:hypothetical protein JAAARDRAFT_197951 [Jaapia argillacea MUCL 33604]|uniref:DRBM domain-containing protein n=1 Tax=Jaapia argillacea MUCL 33604 TaxID=933084 RepID=A0A067PNL5_9AGAM|nr:hypothetical protein JAAARDRAFT_197951 [Jaapia argillacea MUCL 33604]